MTSMKPKFILGHLHIYLPINIYIIDKQYETQVKAVHQIKLRVINNIKTRIFYRLIHE